MRSAPANLLDITDGEVNFLRSFIQGSIMNAETWNRLMRAWGMCERHGWLALAVDMAFRHRYLLGPAVLYSGLARQAVAALGRGVLRDHRKIASRLKSRAPCVVCDADIRGGGGLKAITLERGKDLGELGRFAVELVPFWTAYQCPQCSDHPRGQILCREHLRKALLTGSPVDIKGQRDLLSRLSRQVALYQESFTSEHRGIDGPADRAALLATIGWCSGWRPFLNLLGCATG